MTMSNDITEIKVAIGKVEQHLSDMNGKMVGFNRHMIETCPDNRKDIYTKIDKLKEKTIKNGAVMSVLIIAINAIVIYLIGR